MEAEAYHMMAATEERHWWYCGRRAVADAVISSLNLPKASMIVEIGAGTGGNIAMLARFGRVTAIEMNDIAREIALEKTGHRVVAGHLPDSVPIASESADLVCLFDVLEHVEDDRGSMAAICNMLKPGGRVVLTVPAHRWLWSTHDVELHHFRRYSRTLLRDRLTESGFSIDKLTYTNATLFPIAAIARLADRWRKPQLPSGHMVPPALLNAAMKAVFSAESRVVPFRSLPFGISLLAVGRKRAEPLGEFERLAA